MKRSTLYFISILTSLRFTPVLYFTVVSVLMINSCEPWNMDVRPDHDFVTFVTKISNDADNQGWGILQADDGGFMILGTTIDVASGNADMYLRKLDSEGNLLTPNTFGDSDYEEGVAIVKLEGEDGYALLGNKYAGSDNWQMFWVKTNESGSELKQSFAGLGSLNEDKGYSLVQANGNNFLLFGHTYTYQAEYGAEAVIYKIDTDGQLITRYTYPVTHSGDAIRDDFGYDIIKTSDNDLVILTTYEDETVKGRYDLYLSKISGTDMRTELWKKQLVENCFRIRGTVKEINDGFIVAGAQSPTQMILIKTNPDGEKLISHKYNCTCDLGASVCPTSDGGFIILSSGMTMIKTNANLEPTAEVDFNGTAYGNNCILQTPDQGFVFTGSINNVSNNLDEIVVVKMYHDIENYAPDLD